jgi:cobalt-zinc-cadmium efflux system membrane fusion protein
MFANVSIVINHDAKAVVVPTSALLHENDHRILFVRRNGAYEGRVVHVGAEEQGLIEIVEGVAAGEEVVTRGAYQLKAKLNQDLLQAGHTH